MNTVVERKLIALKFSQELEYILLRLPITHESLTHDIEASAFKGLELLSELGDVADLKHVDEIKKLIEHTNTFNTMPPGAFKTWHLHISEELLDEIALLLMTHGEDLRAHGLSVGGTAEVLVLLVVSGFFHPDFIQHSKANELHRP